ncbi:uncharacterized protein CCOS01_02816 [Colletotrichum costaricense]|uniref:Integral membrane protein n=1 Tax=Colletotrichum costaricense TaxID=1209916 RepID=A0AAI9Z456_9PEZI|nr:uncharacterized protein CCOS01_02816 [Colletotrichum costaricense]KAK1534064.1 hypothetical protein CCOS01_02816 [Colletotrichum costaricense]
MIFLVILLIFVATANPEPNFCVSIPNFPRCSKGLSQVGSNGAEGVGGACPNTPTCSEGEEVQVVNSQRSLRLFVIFFGLMDRVQCCTGDGGTVLFVLRTLPDGGTAFSVSVRALLIIVMVTMMALYESSRKATLAELRVPLLFGLFMIAVGEL